MKTMTMKALLAMCVLSLLPQAARAQEQAQKLAQQQEPAQEQRAEVVLETTLGNIRIALFNETPIHRDNFMELARTHCYDSLLFHRVIKDFMVQTGDLSSKHALPGARVGRGELDYTLEPEFRLPQLFHRRGVVAAAREPDRINPEMRSGASQFYIVWGRQLTDAQIGRVQERLDTLTHGRVQITPEMAAVYKTVGGTPHLDGMYTVFGEVVEGLSVVDSIQQVATDKYGRPYTDVRILRVTIVSDPFAPVSKSPKSAKAAEAVSPAPKAKSSAAARRGRAGRGRK